MHDVVFTRPLKLDGWKLDQIRKEMFLRDQFFEDQLQTTESQKTKSVWCFVVRIGVRRGARGALAPPGQPKIVGFCLFWEKYCFVVRQKVGSCALPTSWKKVCGRPWSSEDFFPREGKIFKGAGVAGMEQKHTKNDNKCHYFLLKSVKI